MISFKENIGSAKDNQYSPIHDWYKFTAGFSYKFVENLIDYENLRTVVDSKIFDPFAGCGTTLVSSQKLGVQAIGNESQEIMFDIIRAKLNWDIQDDKFIYYINSIKSVENSNFNLVYHPLLSSLYDQLTLKTIYLIKDGIEKITEEDYRLFFKLALSQTLHKVSIHPIAVPYITRNKILSRTESAWSIFTQICLKMLGDVKPLSIKNPTSKIYNHDSRKVNPFIEKKSCNLCITSPPYLNNLDYGEVSKVHSHFYGITNNWNDITKTVREGLVTGSTTHYKNSNFCMDDFIESDFVKCNSNISDELIDNYYLIKNVAEKRNGKKSFHILMMYYFKDMFHVLNEIRRVLNNNAKAYLILGDSAPYGVYINTTKILGEMALNCGFDNFRVYKIRSRGTKWKTLRYRHNKELSENILVIQ